MPECIERSVAIARITALEVTEPRATMAEVKRVLADTPTVDAVPVVRCRDCKHSYITVDARCCSHGAFYDVAVPDDFFCALAKRKDGDDNAAD